MLRKTLALIASTLTCFTVVTHEQAYAEMLWQSNTNITNLKKIELGTWSFADDAPNQWADNEGNTKTHKYPSCYLLDLSAEGDVQTGRGYILKDIVPMFGPDGLLKDKNNNLSRLNDSPLMTGTEIVHEATGGPVEVDFVFGSGGFGNRLCYYYAPANSDDKAVDRVPQALVNAFANNEIPTFCIDPQMRTSKHMERYKKNADGEWEKLDKSQYEFRNDHLGAVIDLGPETNYGGWGDDRITGKKFRLKYFGENYEKEASDYFPAGTRIYFFLVTYNDDQWNGDDENETREPYSVKFASRKLNAEFGTQGNWWNLSNHKEYGEKYGTGVMAAAAINFWFVDSDTGVPVNLNLLSWEDRVQPEKNSGGDYKANSDYDMGDVAFALYGVKNPVTDISESDPVKLRVDPWSSYTPEDNTNHYTHWLNILNDGNSPLRSGDLQPMTFKDGKIEPSYTWVSISQYENDGDTERPVGFLVIRKTATLDGRSEGNYQTTDLIDQNLKIKLDYTFAKNYGQDLSGAIFSTLQNEFTRGLDDLTPLDFSKFVYEYKLNVKATGSHSYKYGYRMSFALNGGKIRTTNIDKVMIPRSDIIVEPRGTVSQLDLTQSEEKHFDGKLSPINNRVYVTVRCSNVIDMEGKDKIKALVLSGTSELKHYKGENIPDVSDNILCVLTQGENGVWSIAKNNKGYKLAGYSVHDDACWVVLEADRLPSEEIHAAIFTQFTDVKNNQIDNNFYGMAPKTCQLPAVKLDVDINHIGVAWDDGKENVYPSVYQAATSWSVDGFDDASGIIFSQWRAYNDGYYKWNDAEKPYLNILYGSEPRTGTVPADFYNSWLTYPETSVDASAANQLTFTDGKWNNADVLVQPYNSNMQVDADYLLRAYYQPAAPENLQIVPQSLAAQNNVNANYVVLEATQSASAHQKFLTGIENITSENDQPRFYNLQGIRVSAPQHGEVYIVVRGAKVSKEIFRN